MTAAVQGTVATVAGRVPAAGLGPTLVHEHVFVRTPEMQANYPGEWGSDAARVADAVRRLTAVRDAGYRTVVDPTVVGLGRDVRLVAEVAAGVPGLNVVVATGLYTYDALPPWFDGRGPGFGRLVGVELVDPMTALFVGDIVEGIAGTGIRAGLLKCAIDAPGLTRGVERVLRAVARAHHETGVPVMVHTHPSRRTGLDAHRVLCEQEAVPPARVMLAHSGDTTDCDHLAELADLGVVLGMDRFGFNVTTTFQARADTLVEMCKRGYAGSMALSHDAACYLDWLAPAAIDALPQWNFLHLHDEVLPYARGHGVTEEQIATMLVEVPQRFLATI